MRLVLILTLLFTILLGLGAAYLASAIDRTIDQTTGIIFSQGEK